MENKRIKIQNCFVDIMTKKDAHELLNKRMWDKKSTQIITINPEMIIQASKDKKLQELINSADLIVPDGVGVKLALKLKGVNAEQIRGVDFAYDILKQAEENQWRAVLLGAKEDVLNGVLDKLKKEMPNLNVVYARNGYFDNQDEVVKEIVEKKPQVLLSALGFPKQEIVNKLIKDKVDDCVSIGIGGSFDVWSGKVCEAPKIWRKLNLEWLYRTIKQPERFKRIFPTLPIFLLRSIIEMTGYKKNGR